LEIEILDIIEVIWNVLILILEGSTTLGCKAMKKMMKVRYYVHNISDANLIKKVEI
jgi:hypothetical protein